MKKLKLSKLIASTLVIASILALNPIGANAEWRQNSNGWWYAEGSSWAIGEKQIDNHFYYFDASGYMETGWKKINGRWKYFDDNGCEKIGLIQYGDKTYCTGPNGYMITNTSAYDWYFDNDGVGTKCINIGEFEIDKASGTIVSYKGNDTSLVIPSELEGIEIKRIGFSAFANSDNLTSITVPENITYIGFLTCKSLTSINVDDNNKNYSSVDGVLFNKSKTALIKFPQVNKNTSYVIPDGVTSIGYGAFYGCSNLTSIAIPNSVTSISGWAFDDCKSLTSINIPDSVTSIKKGAFSGCNSVTNINISSGAINIENGAFENYKNTKFNVKNEGIKQLLINSGVSENQIIVSSN